MSKVLTLTDYRDRIALDDPIGRPAMLGPDDVPTVVRGLVPEAARVDASLPSARDDLELIQAALTVRPPGRLPPEVAESLDRLLAAKSAARAAEKALRS